MRPTYGYLFYCSTEIITLFPKIKILIFYVPCSQNCLCSPIPLIFTSPQPKGMGNILLLVWILSASGSAWLLVCTLSPDQWVDFDQTCTDTLLVRGKEVIRLWWPWPLFQDQTSTLKFSNFEKKKKKRACLHHISWTKWRILAKLHIL